jgi:ligand-binding sensor domain-containing protein
VIPKKKLLLRALVGSLMLILAAAGFVRWRVQKALDSAALELADEQEIQVTVQPYHPAGDQRMEWIDSPSDLNSGAEFRGRLFLAGSSGVNEYDDRGTLVREYRVGRDLPQSPVRQLLVGTLIDGSGPELIVVTAREGILSFDGRSFRQIRAQRAQAREITCALVLPTGRLLIGTEKMGVLAYDGRVFKQFHPTLAEQHITALAGDEGELWVGTQKHGVLRHIGGRTEVFGTEQGLPDQQVAAIAKHGDTVLVGTAFGIAEFSGGKLLRTIAEGTLVSSLFADGGKVLAATLDQGLLELPIGKTRGPRVSGSSVLEEEIRGFLPTQDGLLAIVRDGVFKDKNARWTRVLSRPHGRLTDGNISALNIDDNGRLWVGYFDRGLDILERDGRSRHFENEHVFCINRILATPEGNAVATANGLVLFDRSGIQRQVLTKADGLIANHVTDVSLTDTGMVLATPAGLTFLEPGNTRSLYAFHGLVNNHVYAVGRENHQLLVGTLGGLSVLDPDRVRASFTTATSGLPHNWITALVPVGREWFVGTYGAGVLRLDEFGRFHVMDVASGKIEINPTAMKVTPQYVAAGTLGRGLLVYNRQKERWISIADGLPSTNVTALATGDGYLYVGTDNGLVRIPEQSLNQ